MSKNIGPREAARRLGIGMPRVYALLYSGKLPASKQRNRWLISESAVAERLRRVEGLQACRAGSIEGTHV